MLLRKKEICQLAAMAIAFSSALPAPSRAAVLNLETFMDLARRCGPSVAAPTLAAVAKTESGFETLALNDNTIGKPQSYSTLEEAVSSAERLVARGDSVDLGLMQINSGNLGKLGLTVRDAFDPCKSIAGGASILTRNFLDAKGAPTEQVALRDAISAYNTGNRTGGYRNGYVGKVERAAGSLPPGFAPGLAGARSEERSYEVWDDETSSAVWSQDQNSPPPDPAPAKSSRIVF